MKAELTKVSSEEKIVELTLINVGEGNDTTFLEVGGEVAESEPAAESKAVASGVQSWYDSGQRLQ